MNGRSGLSTAALTIGVTILGLAVVLLVLGFVVLLSP